MIFCGPGDPTMEDYSELIACLSQLFGENSRTFKEIYETFRDTRDREFRKFVMKAVRMDNYNHPKMTDADFDAYRRHTFLYLLDTFKHRNHELTITISNDL